MNRKLNTIFYQIDYIDKDGLATYINTFQEDELVIAKYYTNILNHANYCLNKDTKFVLDKYGTYIPSNIYDDEYENILLEYNITKAETINERVKNAEERYN